MDFKKYASCVDFEFPEFLGAITSRWSRKNEPALWACDVFKPIRINTLRFFLTWSQKQKIHFPFFKRQQFWNKTVHSNDYLVLMMLMGSVCCLPAVSAMFLYHYCSLLGKINKYKLNGQTKKEMNHWIRKWLFYNPQVQPLKKMWGCSLRWKGGFF